MTTSNKILVFGLFLGLTLLSCNSTKNEETDDAPETTIDVVSTNLLDYSSFLDEILMGYNFKAIAIYMVQTPFQFLGETDVLMNYQTVDGNKVNQMVTFHKHRDDPNVLSALVYNLDFKQDNSNLVAEYKQKLISQLDEAYGEVSVDFSTGYNEDGNFEATWIFEAGVLNLTAGINFIQVDLREH